MKNIKEDSPINDQLQTKDDFKETYIKNNFK
jgi:hypothetical protein